MLALTHGEIATGKEHIAVRMRPPDERLGETLILTMANLF